MVEEHEFQAVKGMNEDGVEGAQKRISFDLRGKNAMTFEEFRVDLAKALGFDISPSKAVLWALHRLKTLERELVAQQEE